MADPSILPTAMESDMLPFDVNMSFVRDSYSRPDSVDRYVRAFHTIQTSPAEKALFLKYLPQNGHILDVGCGVGRGAKVLRELGFSRVTGVDVAELMVEKARELFVQTPGYRFEERDLTAGPPAVSEYDGAIAIHGIMPIPGFANRVKALKNISASLRSEGHLVMATFLRSSEDENVGNDYTEGDGFHLLSEAENIQVYIHIPDSAEIEEAFEQAGFEMVEMVLFHAFENNDQAEIHSSQNCMYTVGRRE